MRSLELTTLLAILAPAAIAGSSTLILDDFDADPNDDAGGPRELSLSTYADPFGQGGSFEVDTGYNFGGDAGAVIFNSGAGAELVGEIVWNNGGAGLNLDTTALGLQGFELDFQFVDQDFGVSIRLNTFEGSGTVYANYEFVVSAGTDLQTVSVSLADFFVGGGFDPANVDQITLTLNPIRTGTPALNFIMTEFRATVPAPATATLALGCLALGRRRR
jgi:hypothetical protein